MRLGLGISVPGRHARNSIPPPVLSAISRSFGSTAGDTLDVTLTGTNLTGATAVKVGVTNAASYTVNSATSITFRVPAKTAGTYDVSVTTAGGTATLSSAYDAIAIKLWRESGSDSTLNGSAVSAEVDHSGLGNHPTQSTGSMQPLYVASSANFNGKPSVTFDGVDDMLVTPPIDLTGGYVVFQVARFSALQNYNGFWLTSADPTTGFTGHGTYVQSIGALQVRTGGGSSGGQLLSAISANTKYLYVQAQGSNVVSAELNGAALTLSANTLANTAAAYPVYIGGGINASIGRTNGDHPATIVVAGSLTVGQVAAIRTYLNTKYAVF